MNIYFLLYPEMKKNYIKAVKSNCLNNYKIYERGANQ